MITTTESNRRSFNEYARLLIRLHELIAQGKGDDEEADALRDQLDAPWHQLSEVDLSLARGLSADLYSMGVQRPSPEEGPTPEETEEFNCALANDNWARALELIRANEVNLMPGHVALIRGMCWAHLHQPQIAIPFLEEAFKLGENDTHCRMWLLSCLILADRTADAVPWAKDIASSEKNPLLLLKASEVLSVQAGQVDPAEAVALRRQAIDVAQRGLALVKNTPIDDSVSQEILKNLRVTAYLHLAMNHEQLGNTEQARQACQNALELEPGNVNALMVHGWLHEAADEFHRGLGHRLAFQASVSLPVPSSFVLSN